MKDDRNKKTRQSGIELLRIVALLLVIVLHYCEVLVPAFKDVGGIYFHISLWIRSLAACAVDIFLIISGYFMCTSNARVWGKPLSLILQVCVYNELMYIVEVICGIYPLSIRHVVSSFVPDSYYSTLFVVLYLISPYINRTIRNFTQREWKILMTFVIVIFSLLSSVSTLLSEFTGNLWMGVNTIGAWGSQQGFNIVNFILLYIVGAYIRLSGVPVFLSTKAKQIIVVIICITVTYVFAEFEELLPVVSMRFAWVYDNPIIILTAVCLFLLFREFNFRNSFVNYLATFVYPVFLIHCAVVKYTGLENLISKPYLIPGHFLIFCVIMFVCSIIIYTLYGICTKKIIERANQKAVYYFED